jgi:hypothetical protein
MKNSSSGGRGYGYDAAMERAEVLSKLEVAMEREAVHEGASKYNGNFVLIRTRGGADVWAEVLTTAEMLHLIDTGLEITWSAGPDVFNPMPYRDV